MICELFILVYSQITSHQGVDKEGSWSWEMVGMAVSILRLAPLAYLPPQNFGLI